MDEGPDEAAGPQPIGKDELFELIVESADDFAIFTTDGRGLATSWNRGAERLFGYAEDEILGRSADVVFTPEDRAAGMPEEERRRGRAEGRAEDERWHQRKDGSRFWASGLMMPLKGHAGGFVKITRDRTDRYWANEQLRENEARFRLLATNIPQLVFRSHGNGERTWGSPQWSRFTGLDLDASLEFGWLDAVHPDDREATLAAWREAQGTGEYYVEHRILREGTREHRWHQTRARPVDDDGGAAADWVGTSTDIHELKGLQDRQQVLMAELQHRTRNLLALVQAIARQMLRTSTSLAAFRAEFESRLRALSRVQGLLACVDHDAAIGLHDLIGAELTAHGAGDGPGKVQIEGPAVAVPATSAQALGLALHELATNAVKHGALAQTEGKLAVAWRLDEGGPERRILLDWRESGVAMAGAGAPRRRGYGSELIERALPYQLRADTKLEFGPDGVRCTIAVPIARAEGNDG